MLDFWIPWEPSPTVAIATVALGVLYARGSRRERTPWLRRLAFWLGFVMVYVVLHTRVDYYAQREFFVHRLQHMILHHLGPFLLALAWPGPTLRAGMPDGVAGKCFDRLWRSPPVRLTMDVLMHPVVAVVLFFGLIWLWLVPVVHFYAMLDARLYLLMNWSMLIDGLIFWCLVLDPRTSPPARLGPGVRVLLLVAVIPPQVVSGALITFAPHVIYPLYDLCGRAFAGVSSMTDQTVGGLILWIPSTMMEIAGALVVLYFWYRHPSATGNPKS